MAHHAIETKIKHRLFCYYEPMENQTKWSNPDHNTHKEIAKWAASCAEHVLHFFEEVSPADKRPSHAIEVLRSWINDETTMVDCRKAAFAAHAAARESTNPSAIAAARAAGQAAAVAHMWNHAPHAANYAIISVKSSTTEGESATAMEKEHSWQLRQLDDKLKIKIFPSKGGV